MGNVDDAFVVAGTVGCEDFTRRIDAAGRRAAVWDKMMRPLTRRMRVFLCAAGLSARRRGRTDYGLHNNAQQSCWTSRDDDARRARECRRRTESATEHIPSWATPACGVSSLSLHRVSSPLQGEAVLT